MFSMILTSRVLSMKDTKLIFVMGSAGTGKSSLLNELTGMDLHVGKSLKSGRSRSDLILKFHSR